MKISIPENLNPVEVVRRAGYGRLGRENYTRRLGQGRYPRFHIYLQGRRLNIHLDQKAPSYQGQRAHNAEYGQSGVLNQEKERLWRVIAGLATEKNKPAGGQESRQSGWRRFFGPFLTKKNKNDKIYQ